MAAWTGDAGLLVGLSLLHVALFAPPGAAAAVISVRAGVRDPALAAATGLVAIGAFGYLVFWAYLLNPLLGEEAAVAVTIAALLAGAALAAPAWRRAAGTLAALWRPLVLWAGATVFALAVTYDHGGLQHPLQVTGERFSQPLPNDNEIPYLFAQALASFQRPLPSPLLGDWLSSDRPPLQAGLVLTQLVTVWPNAELHYEVLAAALQALWLPGLWCFLALSGMRSRAPGLALVTTATSGWVLLNTAHVWPKLIATAFVLVCCGLTLGARPARGVGAGMLAGLAAGLAMLAHEGSAFALIGLAVAALALRRLPTPRFAAAALAAVAACLLPWFAYQQLYDPPGNRLLKWHLAGVEAITTEPALPAISHAYQRAGLSVVVSNKLQNLGMLFGDPAAEEMAADEFFTGVVNPTAAKATRFQVADQIRFQRFFHVFPLLGLGALGPLLLLARRWRRGSAAGPEAAVATTAWVMTAGGVVAWCVILFGPHATSPHQGPYSFEILAAAGTVLAAWALSPRLAWALAALAAGGDLLLYAVLSPALDSPAQAITDGLNPLLVVVAAGALAALVTTALSPTPPAAAGSCAGSTPSSRRTSAAATSPGGRGTSAPSAPAPPPG